MQIVMELDILLVLPVFVYFFLNHKITCLRKTCSVFGLLGGREELTWEVKLLLVTYP